MTRTNKLFCFGYGYSCDYLGHELQKRDGWTLAGTTRTAEKRQTLRGRGIDAHIFDYERPLPDPQSALKNTTHLLISTPPGENGDPTFNAHSNDIAEMKNLQWVGYLSTTGVYGDRCGDWVDETSELRPSSIRGSRRVKAEEQWHSLCQANNLPLHIFRLAGIYGPGRSALDTVRFGSARRINKPGHIFSRIHVEDIAQILLKSIEKAESSGVYNVCDDEPAPSHEIISYACELLGKHEPPLIPFEQAEMSPMARSFYSDNKRVHNKRIKQELGVELKYKNYKEGLKACLDAERHALSIFSKHSNKS